MHAIDPTLVTALVAVSATVLMVQAGVAKRALSWRPAHRHERKTTRRRG
jgi:hypothetical protein